MLAGPKVDAQFHVLREDGAPVENLYAVGILMFGNMFGDTADDLANGSLTATMHSVGIVNCSGALAGIAAAAAIA